MKTTAKYSQETMKKNEASEINILKITTQLTKRLKPRDSKKYY